MTEALQVRPEQLKALWAAIPSGMLAAHLPPVCCTMGALVGTCVLTGVTCLPDVSYSPRVMPRTRYSTCNFTALQFIPAISEEGVTGGLNVRLSAQIELSVSNSVDHSSLNPIQAELANGIFWHICEQILQLCGQGRVFRGRRWQCHLGSSALGKQKLRWLGKSYSHHMQIVET